MKSNVVLTGIVVVLLINSITLLLIGYNTFKEVEEVEVEFEGYTIQGCEDLAWETEENWDECVSEGLLRIYGFVVGEGCVRNTEREICSDGQIADFVLVSMQDACWESFPPLSEVFAKCLEKVE